METDSEPQENQQQPEGRYLPNVTRYYQTDQILVRWEPGLCIHSANCVTALPRVFNPGLRPWVDVTRASADEIARAIMTCPSGALTFARLDLDSNEERASILASVPLFSELDHASLTQLESFASRHEFRPGELLVEEGHPGDGLYVVVSGAVEIVKGLASEDPEVIAVLGQGEPIGEMALLGDWKRSASVRAIGEVECLGLERSLFLGYMYREPRIAIKLLQMLAERLAKANQKFIE